MLSTTNLLPLVTPPNVNAQVVPTCESKNIYVKVFAPELENMKKDGIEISIYNRLGISILIPDNIVDKDSSYFPILLVKGPNGPYPETAFGQGNSDLAANAIKYQEVGLKQPVKTDKTYFERTPDVGVPELNGKATYAVFEWNVGIRNPNPIANFFSAGDRFQVGITVKIYNKDNPNGKDICRGPYDQITVFNSSLDKVESCPITMSDIYNVNDPVKGSVPLKKLDDTTYKLTIHDGDILSKVSRDQYKPGAITAVSGIPDSLQQKDFSGDGASEFSFTNLKPGKYTAAVYAIFHKNWLERVFDKPLFFACGARVFEVDNNKVTSPPTSSGGTTVNPDRGKGNTVPIVKGCTPGEPGCTAVSEITCNPLTGAIDSTPNSNHKGALTAIGCIPTEPKGFIEYSAKFITALSGGIALLLMAFAAFQMITSAGNAEALKKANDQFYNAIIGLLFVIFAVMLLQVIGYNILGIPGFSGT